MKRIIFGIILATAASTAMATGNSNNGGTHCNGNGSCGTTTNNTYNTTNAPKAEADAKASASAIQGQHQGQSQGQLQGQGQAQGQVAKGGNATNAGNKQTTTITFDEKKQAPGVAVGATTTTASCRVGVGATLSVPGLGVGATTAYKDEKCDKRALGLALIDAARVANGMGAPAEVYAEIFMEGLSLLRASGDDAETPASAEQKSATFQSYVQ